MRWSFTLSAAVLCLAGLASGTAHADTATVDEEILKAAGVATEGPGLIAFFRKQTTAEPTREKVQTLIRNLGHDAFEIREKASAELIALGAAAEPHLKLAVEEMKKAVDADLEALRRAEACLRRIGDRSAETLLVAAAARTLARKQPAGATEALLAYVPSAPAESVILEIQAALASVGLPGGKPVPALRAALTDKLPLRRALAGAALSRAAAVEDRAAARKLLEDRDETVRLRVAEAQISVGEKEAVAVLIELLTQLAPAGAYQAEQILCRLADESAPPVLLGTTPETRAACREQWRAWWKEHGPKLDLARAAGPPRPLGYTLVVHLDQNRVLELDPQNKIRWELKDITFPLDVQLLPGGRILAAEQSANLITERTLKGQILWQKRVVQPLMAQRLPNGHTFFATRDLVSEVDRDGKEVFTYAPHLGEGVMRAQKLPTGEIALVTGTSLFKRLDASSHRELQSFPVNVRTSGGRIEVLPNNHVLVPEKDHNRVVEYDARGTVVWQAPIPEPIAAVRLPNGNTLVTSMADMRAVEINKKGEAVWEYKPGTRVTRAFRR